ncbi:MAG: hypothetical protein RIQ78_610 [Bacteroidota bacterium]|jgi:hypothetical protein
MSAAPLKTPLLPIRLLACILFILFWTGTGIGQNRALGSWSILNLKYSLNEKWSIFAEGQLGSLKFYDDFYFHDLKGGVSYKINKNVHVTLVAGDYDTFREGGNFVLPRVNNEFRIWPQLIVMQPFHKFKVEHRYRTDFRFTSNGYRNRYRYRLSLFLPLGKEKNGYPHFQLCVGNELFFTDKGPYFERNRVLCYFNCKISKNTALLAGFMHQFDYKLTKQSSQDYLLLGVFTEILHKKQP